MSGGRGGIGAAIVAALQQEGARVAALDLPGTNGTADLDVDCDVTDPASVAAAIAEVRSTLGVPGLVVCGAGVVSESPLVDLDDSEWHRVLDVSLTGAFLLLRAALPGLCEHGGSIVAISSGWGTKGYPNGSHYAAAKAGVEALVKSVALESAGAGVRVNAVAPGPVLTPLLDHIDAFDEWRRQREAAIPLGRLGEPKDVVGPVLFLLGDESSYVTGQVLHVNGGLLMP